jgi:hypothetical protein
MKKKHINRFLEFLLIGMAMGIVEDLIAVSVVSGNPIDLRTVFVIALIAFPFAAFSELIVDRKDFSFLRSKN